MRLIDADQMAADENEAYMNASLFIKDNVNSGINYVVHTKIQRLIADTPTADPMKHGHWKKSVFADITCSNCDFSICIANSVIPKMLYCPNCGARMDEDERTLEYADQDTMMSAT